MADGKKIVCYLMDGKATGKIKCSINNWSGIAYKIPKTRINECNGIDQLHRSGIYFLLDTNENRRKDTVYVGQAVSRKNGKGLLSRALEKHDSINWSEAFFLTAENDFLGSTELNYLENRFYNLIKEADKCEIANGVEPNIGNVSEEQECELEEFIDNAMTIMGTLGYKMFSPQVPQVLKASKDRQLFYLEKQNISARGRISGDWFIVLQGSTINPKPSNNCTEHILKLRRVHADKIGRANKLKSDIRFQSPSAAASFVTGSQMNGKTCWHDEEGRTLKSYE